MNWWKARHPLDRWVWGISAVSTLMVILVLQLGSHSFPFVKEFSWRSQEVHAWDTVFSLTFNRAMDPESVEQHLQIDPPLPGRIQWQGRRLVYTLTQPARYGNTYRVRLADALDGQGQPMQEPFAAEFHTPPLRYVTVGVTDTEMSRLVLVDMATQTRTMLSPEGVRVLEFHPGRDPQGDAVVYYLATSDTPQTQDLFQVSLSSQTSKLLLDHRQLQNMRFQVSPDGTMVLVDRLDPQDPGVPLLWIRRPSDRRFHPLRLSTPPVGDYLITPDNQGLLLAQGQGLAIMSLDPGNPDVDFLAQYGQALTIKPDGTQAALIRFQSDYTRTLWILTNTGRAQSLLTVSGSVLSGQFAPASPELYVLVTDLNPDTFAESPSLRVLNWQTGLGQEWVRAEFPTELAFSLAPDGTSLLYSQMDPVDPQLGDQQPRAPLSPSGQPVGSGQVWWIPIPTSSSPAVAPESFAPRALGTGTQVSWIP